MNPKMSRIRLRSRLLGEILQQVCFCSNYEVDILSNFVLVHFLKATHRCPKSSTITFISPFPARAPPPKKKQKKTKKKKQKKKTKKNLKMFSGCT